MLVDHVFMVGKTDRVRSALDKSKQHKLDYHSNPRRNFIVEVDDPPIACGLKVAAHFRNMVKSRFNVPVLEQCLITKAQVDCETRYLPKYQRTLLQLRYERKEDLWVGLYSLQQTRARTRNATLSRGDVLWIQNLFFELSELAEKCPA